MTLIVAIIACVVGIVIGCVITSGSASESNQVQADESGYLNYCGKQLVCGDKREKYVEVYEDTQHNKVLYVGTDGWQHSITLAVSDLN